ncbi:MAG: PQQ-binding-like beta-propeller repeat protein [Mycobacteriales bacterium]
MSRRHRAARSVLAVYALGLGLVPATSTAAMPTAAMPTAAMPAAAMPAPLPLSSADWTTYHYTAARSGNYAQATHVSGPLRPAWRLTLDGAVYAEPLVIGGTVVVATENNSVYGIRGGAVVWRARVGAPAPRSTLPCGNIDPLGITGTPVYDPTSGLVYAVAEQAGTFHHRLVGINPATGVISISREIDPAGAQPRYQQQRGALTVTGGKVWIPFGGLAGDCGPYHGYLVGSALSLRGALAVYQTPSAREAAIWTPPGASVDSAGHLYVSVGNGASTAPPYDDSDSVVELSGATKISLFAPSGWAGENASDLDLGSQGPALVGGYVFIAGKSGIAYTLRAGALGGIGGEVSSRVLCTSFGGTAVVGSTVYVPCSDGIRAEQITSTGGMHTLWHTFTSVAGSPVVGGGAVWAMAATAGVLHEMDPATGATITEANVGVTSRFATPTLTGNTVIVGTLTGVVALAFG